MKIPIVDENDNFLYYKESSERDERKESTRGASLWLTNEKGEVLIAKRAKQSTFSQMSGGTRCPACSKRGKRMKVI